MKSALSRERFQNLYFLGVVFRVARNKQPATFFHVQGATKYQDVRDMCTTH